MPNNQRAFFTRLLMIQLAKKDPNGRYTALSKSRPIGMSDSTLRDACRPGGSRAAAAIGPLLQTKGQYAVSVRSGGEAVAMACQCLHDISTATVTMACDCTNAFCLLENEAELMALRELIAIAKNSGDEKLRAAAEATLEDHVFYYTHEVKLLTNLEGRPIGVSKTRGVTQGGMYSMVGFCTALAILVNQKLQEEFPNVIMRCIADDCHVQVIPTKPQDLIELAKWACRYDELMTSIGMRNNISKFKLLQSAEMKGQPLDIMKAYRHFPTQKVMHPDGVSRETGPEVTREAININGVAIGPCRDARSKLTVKHTASLEARCKVLEAYSDRLPLQTADLYARQCYKPGTVLNHQARGIEPSVGREAAQRVGENQTRLFRVITGAQEHFLPDTQGPYQDNNALPAEAAAHHCAESLTMPASLGGLGWTHPVVLAGPAHAGKVIDVLPVLRTMADVTGYIGKPSEWGRSPILALREAHETITAVMGLESFRVGPRLNREYWLALRAKLQGPTGEFDLDLLSECHGMHIQHVLYHAVAQQTWLNLVSDISLPIHVRARIREASEPGASSIFSIDSIRPSRRGNIGNQISDGAFRWAVFKRIGHQQTMVTVHSRCGCRAYCQQALPAVPGPLARVMKNGTQGPPRQLPEWYHYHGFHWDSCVARGHVTHRHNELSKLIKAAFLAIGSTCSVEEVSINPSRKPAVKGDWVVHCHTGGPAHVVGDTTVISPFIQNLPEQIASGATSATAAAERRKTSQKDKYAVMVPGRTLLIGAFSTYGGIGADLIKVIDQGFKRKAARAKGTGEGVWTVQREKKNLLEEMGATIAAHNFAIVSANIIAPGGQQSIPTANLEPYDCP